MIIFRILIIVFVVFVFSSCSFFDQPPRYEKLAHETTAKVAKELKKQKGLILIGTGGAMMDDIQMLAMGFNYYHEVSLEQARDLVSYAIKNYLSSINESKEIRPYLHEYPFTAKNVEIRIWIYKPDRSFPSLDKIDYISAINGIITYYLDLPEKYARKAICRETYEEALQKVPF